MNRARSIHSLRIAAAVGAVTTTRCGTTVHNTAPSGVRVLNAIVVVPDECPECETAVPAHGARDLAGRVQVTDAIGPVPASMIHYVIQSALQSDVESHLRCWIEVNRRTVRIVIDATGHTAESSIEPQPPAPGIYCVQDAVNAWRFPATPGGGTTTAHVVVDVQTEELFDDVLYSH